MNRILKFSKVFRSISTTSSSSSSLSAFGKRDKDKGNGYVVLIPEIPSDTRETNELLNTEIIPDFKSVNRTQWRNALIKLSLELETTIWKIEEDLKSNPSNPPTFDKICEIIDDSSVPFEVVWSLLKTMSIVRNDIINIQGYSKLHETAVIARSKKYQSETLYKYWRDLEIPTVGSNPSSTPKSRLISKYLTEGNLSGICLIGKKRKEFIEITNSLEQQKEIYNTNLETATNRFKHLIIDPKYIGSMPIEGLVSLSKSGDEESAKRGPWILRLNSPSYDYFLQYCPERALRWNAWQGNVSRASNTGGDKNISNSIFIEEIRTKRASIAKLLGYESYAQLSMVTKMAGNLENVKTMIASLFVVANPKQSEEISSLQTFAESRGFEHKLKLWDVPYWRRKQAKSLYNVDNSVTESYFPYPVVLSKLFSFASDVFGIVIKKVDNKRTWNEDVEFYSVEDENGEIFGHFFIDPYKRPGEKLYGSWMLGNRPKYDKLNLTPLSTLIFNFRPPIYGKPSLLSMDELTTLFEKFGEMLQCICSRIPYPEVGGTNNIEWDATKAVPKFMSMWLGNHNFVSGISSHFESGDPMSDKMVDDLLKSRNHLSAYDISHELYLSHLDIELYSTSEFWLDVCKGIWGLYKSSGGFLLDKSDSHPCSFHEIFSGNWAGSYYSHLWSRMLGADLYRGFVENAKDKSKWEIDGKRFRMSYLSFGGGVHPSEVFRQFRGRDPSPDALLWTLGLKKFNNPTTEQVNDDTHITIKTQKIN